MPFIIAAILVIMGVLILIAKGIGNRLTGYVPIILYHFHYAGVNIFSLQFGFIGIYVQISAMELMLCSNHNIRKYFIAKTAVVLVLPSVKGWILQSSETNFERHFQTVSLKNVARKLGVGNPSFDNVAQNEYVCLYKSNNSNNQPYDQHH